MKYPICKFMRRTRFFGEYCNLIIIFGRWYFAKSCNRFRIIIDLT